MTPTTDESTLEEMFTPTGANPEAFALGMKDYSENNPQPNPFDYATNRDAFNSYARGWLAGKSLNNTEKTTLHLPGRTDIIPRDPPQNDAETLMRECLEHEAKQREDIAATPLRGCAEIQRRKQEGFTLGKMREFGGGFVRALAAAYECADSDNCAKLRAAFPEIFEKYSAWPRSTQFHGSESTAI